MRPRISCGRRFIGIDAFLRCFRGVQRSKALDQMESSPKHPTLNPLISEADLLIYLARTNGRLVVTTKSSRMRAKSGVFEPTLR